MDSARLHDNLNNDNRIKGVTMDLNAHKGKLAVFVLVALVMIAFLSGSLINSGSAPQGLASGVEQAALTSEELTKKCDDLAAYPGDPMRTSAPVDDASFATAAAVSACEAALAADTANSRIMFNLGRALYLSGQYELAYENLKAARLAGYSAASLLLGDAYRDGKLPDGEVGNLNTAMVLYEEAERGGVESASAALLDAKRELDRSTFDKSLFQNGDYMEKLYTGDFSKTGFPVSVLHYMQGIAYGFEDSNVLFIDQACKPLLSKVGIDLLNSEAVESAVVLASTIGSQDEQGNWSSVNNAFLLSVTK